MDLVRDDESDGWQLGKAGLVGRKFGEWQIDARRQLIGADRIVLHRLPIDPGIVLALIVDTATRRPGARNPGKAASGEVFRVAGKAAAGPDQRRPEIGCVERGVGQWVVGPDLGVAVDDRVGPIRIALRIRPGALRIAREQREVIGLRWVVDTMGIREVAPCCCRLVKYVSSGTNFRTDRFSSTTMTT